MSDELPAGRDLDAAVARAMGNETAQINGRWWRVVGEDRYGTIPYYSAPSVLGDRAALLDCIKWLAKSGIGISIESDGTHVGPILTNIDGTGVWVVSVPGFDEAAFALAISRAVVKAASFFA
jgi:hypothetical protein